MCLLWILLEVRNHWKFLWRLIFVIKSEISCFCGCYFLPKVRYHHRPNNCKERYWSVEESSNKWFCPNMKSNLNILEKVLNFSMCLLVCGEREREREREETMGLRNWEIMLEEMRIKMGDEVKTFEPNCYVNKSSPCNGISCLWEGKKSQSHIQKGRLQCLNCSNSFPTKWLSSIGHILNWLSH